MSKHPTMMTRTAELVELRRDMERRIRKLVRQHDIERDPIKRALIEGNISGVRSYRIKLRETYTHGEFRHGWQED